MSRMLQANNPDALIVGAGRFQYRAVEGWDQLPPGWQYVDVVGVATDSRDRVYVFNRGEHPLVVFDADGNFLREWGAGKFVRPHGIMIGPDDLMYLIDDKGHSVRKYTLEGDLLQTVGPSGQASDTGVVDFDYRTMKQAAPPFHFPTNLALAPDGQMFVSDGYGNARVHRFSPEGNLLQSWGDPGDGPGQFHLPHGVCLDSNQRVFVADRENNRLQIFSTDGEYQEQWTDVARPTNIFIDAEDNVFVSEAGMRVGLFPWMEPDWAATGGRISIFSKEGNLLARWGGGDDPCAPTDFFVPHDVWLDSRGSIYIGEVTWAAGGNAGMVPKDCPRLRKYETAVP